MISARRYNSGSTEDIADPATISDVLDAGDSLLWVDLVEPSDADFALLQEEFGLHALALEDARKHGQRPKLEQYGDHVFLVAYSASLSEVDLFVGPTWVVSVRGAGPSGSPWGLDAVLGRFERTRDGEPDVGFLLHTLLDDLVDGYFVRTDEFEDRIEHLEECIFAEGLEEERSVQQELFSVRRDLLEFRRRVAPLREVLASLLRGDVPWVRGAALVHVQDVYDHVLRAIELIDGQRELVGNAAEAHLAIISNRLNAVMRTMTAWGAILLGATLVAAIYGMNFRFMPELTWRFGYPYSLGLMLVVTLVLRMLFRRRGWL